MSLSLGNLTLPHGLILAPMAGVADASFRAVCRECGAEYTVTEMISAKALCYEQLCRKEDDSATKTASLARITQPETPCAVQLFGAEPEYMARAADFISRGDYRGADDGRLPPAAIDINMGCPVHKVVSNGEGSALMKNLPLAERIISSVRRATPLPLTVKLRAGWDEHSKNAVELARIAEACGADLLCVHARTRSQFYAAGTVDLEVIRAVKSAVKIPVVGNGDIFSADDAKRMLDQTECDGVAVARGVLGNPWLFAEIAALLDGKPYTRPSAEERLDFAIRHAEDKILRKGEYIGFLESRPHLAHYTRGLRGSSAARGEIMQASSLEEIRKIFDRLLETEENK